MGLVLAACADAGKEPAEALQRAGRYGSLRDLVLFASTDPVDAEALFVDRFEVTRGDWKEFAVSEAGRAAGAPTVLSGGDPDLPIGGIDLTLARAFAAWRFLRLPRREEWLVAAAVDGRSRYPWGGRDDPLRTNSAELGLGRATPVGTFESGRRGGGDQPYDLVGNVSEWTESVPVAWWSAATSRPRWTSKSRKCSPGIDATAPACACVPAPANCSGTCSPHRSAPKPAISSSCAGSCGGAAIARRSSTPGGACRGHRRMGR